MSGETDKTRLEKVLAKLKAERAAVEEVIAVLRRLALTREKSRGRPPAWISDSGRAPKRGRERGPKNK